MSFDLRIHFAGLALFVPEGEEKMHVLMPSTKDHVHAHPAPPGTGEEPAAGEGPVAEEGPVAGEGPAAGEKPAEEEKIERHFARVVYDEAYEHPNQTQLSRTYKFVDLEGGVLNLTGLPTVNGGIDTRLSTELPSLDKVAEKVPRALVQDPLDARLAARVTMDAGALTDYQLGALFVLDDEEHPTRMTVQTEWTIRGVTTIGEKRVPLLPELVLRDPALYPQKDHDSMDHEPKDGAEAKEGAEEKEEKEEKVSIPTLYPIGQTIHLMVFNATRGAFPPNGPFFIPQPPDEAIHFDAYFSLCKPRAGIQRPETVAAKLVEVDGDFITRVAVKEFPSMTCIVPQAQLADA